MSRKLIASGLIVAALSPLTMAANSSAHGSSGDQLRISAQSGGFFGFVISKKSNCQNGRTVTLYKKKGKKVNVKKDKKIGSDIATPNGDGAMYSIRTDAQGKFYAYTKKKGNGKALVSKVVKAQPPAEEDNLDQAQAEDENQEQVN